MHLAAEKGKHQRLRQFMSGNLDAVDSSGCTALGLAASNGHLRCVTMLLDAKADVNALSDSLTALMFASQYGHLDVVNALIDARADVNIFDTGSRYRQTALHCASQHPNGHPIVAALLAAGALVDVPGAFESPLSRIAYSRGSIESLKLLIAAGADVNGWDYEKQPLSLFTYSGDIASMKLLLEANADVNGRRHAEIFPLYYAARLGNLEMANFLISAGADVTIRNSTNLTCLHAVVLSCIPGEWTRSEEYYKGVHDLLPLYAEKLNKTPCDCPGVFNALVDAKADINARGPDGMTPLHTATLKKNIEAVNALLAAGADPNDVCDTRRSALCMASKNGCLSAVSALVAARADVNCVDSDGFTSILWAANGNYLDVVLALIAAGADVCCMSHSGQSPLLLAVDHNNVDMVSALIAAGADLNCYFESNSGIAHITPIDRALEKKTPCSCIHVDACWRPSMGTRCDDDQ
jgi:ankyrin repeat protein